MCQGRGSEEAKWKRSLSFILTGATDSFWKANPNLVADLAQAGIEQEQNGPDALGGQGPTQKGMVGIAGKVHVVITRHGKRKLDYDNFVGGCKGIRDGIAEDLLGLKGDSEKDGITFEYAPQVVTKETTDTLVEIFKDDSCLEHWSMIQLKAQQRRHYGIV